MNIKDILVVTGLPRSGTSLMMQILNKAGLKIFTDFNRSADTSNPKGYYEHESVKNIESDTSWLDKTRGKAVKIIIPLLFHLPSKYNYKIIFMKREISEIIVSQNKMLRNNKFNGEDIEPTKLEQLLNNQLHQAQNWIKDQPKIECFEVNFYDLIFETEAQLNSIMQFLSFKFDIEDVKLVIDKKLYRTRFK